MGGQIVCVCERASPYSAFAPGGIDRLTQDSDVLMFIKIQKKTYATVNKACLQSWSIYYIRFLKLQRNKTKPKVHHQ